MPVWAISVERLRRKVAGDMADEYGFDFYDVLKWMQLNDVFGNWTDEELTWRPIDLAELADCYDS